MALTLFLLARTVLVKHFIWEATLRDLASDVVIDGISMVADDQEKRYEMVALTEVLLGTKGNHPVRCPIHHPGGHGSDFRWETIA